MDHFPQQPQNIAKVAVKKNTCHKNKNITILVCVKLASYTGKNVEL